MIIMPADNSGLLVGWLAGRYPGSLGHLHSPRLRSGGFCSPPGPFPFLPYALDNGAFKDGENWSETAWLRLLEWARLSGQAPLWVLVPDVVGDRLRTLRKWDLYAPRLAEYGWPLAFAVQDGMEPEDVPAGAAVVFVGGSTEWKWRTVGMWCSAFPRVHVGRVNTYRRLRTCHEAGAEGCDGSGWFRGNQLQHRGLLAYLQETSGERRRVEQLELTA